ncbi:MAG: phosphomannomutase/phosphoglucomutase [Clostridiales bacterium]|jgi:phosphomannomutase/phosphoglucomutase|nr:phosphomannomutase/phosphoglucomutase [Eubacteriales bacterium]MDH7565721.1 phosphomannomutase/phosphoglucomutase [Clostridiales bacterium]
MAAISNQIFRQYDIRGIFSRDLTAEDAELIGRAFGTYIRRKGETAVVVGRDNRKSSPALHEHLVKGFLETGVDVTDIGVVVTPIFYYSTYLYGINSGVMITASHNPAEYNGFKIQHSGRTLYGAELQEIKGMAEAGSFDAGSGKLICKSPVDDYIHTISDKIKPGGRKLKVVVDCGNGTAGLFAPKVFEKLGCAVEPLYCESDPDFPNHFPDPSRPENLKDMIKAVQENKADLGLGFDGDGDRIGVVDDKGKIIWGDMLMILFWREILPKYPGTSAIVEVKCSDLLVKEIEKLGGKPLFYKTGHSLIKAKMKELNAVFTGEMSGHMFFADEYYGFDDALYTGARLIRLLSNTEKPLSALLEDIPKTYATPEIRVACDEDRKNGYVENAKRYFKGKGLETIDVDGIRVRWNNGWGLVRASNTGPELIVRCEASTREALEQIKSEIARSISPLRMAE